MFFTSLLISLPYSSMRVTSRDGNSLIFTKTFYIMLRFSGQFNTVHHYSALHVVKHGSSIVHLQFTHTKRIPHKSVNSLFNFLSKVQKLHSSISLAYKSTAAVASDMFTYQTAKAVNNCYQVHATRLFLSFLAFCRICFLTLINN